MTGRSIFKILHEKNCPSNKWLFLEKNMRKVMWDKSRQLEVQEIINYIYIGERAIRYLSKHRSELLGQLKVLINSEPKIRTTIAMHDVVRNPTMEEYMILEKLFREAKLQFNKKKNEFKQTDIKYTIGTKQETSRG